MNEPTLNTGDEQLRQLLVTAAGPESLSDREIESQLLSAEPVTALGEDQFRRVVKTWVA